MISGNGKPRESVRQFLRHILGVDCKNIERFFSLENDAGIVVVSLAAGTVLSLQPRWTHISVRTVGSWIAAIGLMSMALS